jgi:hypothetical protein
MRIRDVTIQDVAAGKNWRLKSDTDIDQSMQDWEIEDCTSFSPTDEVVYSALSVCETGEVRPLLLIREVGDPGWWGDTCEYFDGKWRQVGLMPSPEYKDGKEFVASPLPEDPSFMGEYSHEIQRAGFVRWRAGLMKG